MTSKFIFVVTKAEQDVLEARQIRKEVFVQEQGIPAHLDPDGFDDVAFHVLCRAGDELVGTGRLVSVDGAKGVLARIAVRSQFRGDGVGRQIVQKLESVAIAEGLSTLSLQPHRHLEAFYQSLGYHTVPGTDFVAGHELITMHKDIDTLPMSGQCQCGAIGYELTAPGFVSYTCHCQECQKLSSSAFSTCMQVPSEALEITRGEPTSRTRLADSGNELTSWFCLECGSVLFAESSVRPRIRTLFVGTLDEPEAVSVDAHIWVKRKLPWVLLPTGHRIFQGPGDWSQDYAAEMNRYRP